MIKNYIKTTLRHLWRSRLFTGLNILGLAIGISACWIIFRIVDHEFSYDAGLPNSERIFKVISAFDRDGKQSAIGGVSVPLPQGIAEEITGVDHVVPAFRQWAYHTEVKRENQPAFVKEEPEGIVATNGA